MPTLQTEAEEQVGTAENTEAGDAPKKASQLPEPKGYKILIALPEI